MISFSNLKKRWETKHQQRFSDKQPEKGVIEFSKRIKGKKAGMLLDAGCGRGRNSRYLADQGLKVVGCDISLPAIKIAKSNSHELEEKIVYQIGDLTQLPYLESTFDAIISVHVLPYNTKKRLFECVEEINRVLKSNGCIYLDLLDCKDAEYGIGREIEENTFVAEDGIPMHFSDEKEIEELLMNLQIAQQECKRYGRKQNERVVWEIHAIKE